MADVSLAVQRILQTLNTGRSGLQGLVFVFGTDNFAKVHVGGSVVFARCKDVHGEPYVPDVAAVVEEKLANKQTIGVVIDDPRVFRYLESSGVFVDSVYRRNDREYRVF
ncbi:MAG: hypothetical protein Q7R96_00990 [Nanoarchaeota archaeon]|nr:hypothetical protein [Nanoarchaeota archaeon]